MLEYSTDLFDAATAERLAAQLVTVLEALAASPGQRLSGIALVSEAERERPNRTAAAVPEACLHELFEAQADRTPDAVAVRCGGRSLTYAELDRRANGLARRLIQRGAGPGVLVGVCLPRSADAVVALLAVLKAGSGYLPLDPAYPPRRLQYMTADSGAALLLTEVEDEPGSRERQARRARPGDVAYVIYTSGSTGDPKGVVVEHRSVVNLVTWARRALGAAAAAPWTVFHSLSFDYSVWELFAPLSHGGTAVIVPQDLREPADFVALLARERIAVLSVTPSGFGMLTSDQAPWRSADLALAAVVFGGEELRPGHVPDWFHALVPGGITNMYGITEVTVHATAAPVTPGHPVAIGSPLANAALYLLDEHLQPVPPGVTGEIHIGGGGLARGYLNRPALTAQRFIPNPYGPGRLYRTGDYARYRNGALEFAGRRDRQVKIRGYRIELAEIEAALGGDAVVTAADGKLTAYTRTPVNHDHLRATLPAHMIPATFITIDTWPLTPNGKINHNALPAVPAVPETSGFAAPATAVERALAQVWEEVLGVDRVGLRENFFALGGDSITAIHTVARARRAGLVISAKDLFASPTVEELAAKVRGTDYDTDLAEPGPVPLTPIQAWFFGLNPAKPDHWNQSALVRCPETLDAARLRVALDALVARHDALRLRFEGPRQWLAAAAPPVVVTTADAASFEAAAARAQASLNLRHGRLLTAIVCGDQVLLIVHHLVVDAVSWRILVEDLQALYDHRPPAPSTISFARWARRSPGAPVTPQPTVHGVLRSSTYAADGRLVNHNDLVAALRRALRAGFYVEGHGRDDAADLARTVGWFTTINPITAPDPSAGTASVALNYQGRPIPPAEGAWRIVSGGLGGNRAPENGRPYAVELNVAHADDGRLVLRFDHMREQGEIDALAAAVIKELWAETEGPRGYAPEDFPQADLSADELARTIARLQGRTS